MQSAKLRWPQAFVTRLDTTIGRQTLHFEPDAVVPRFGDFRSHDGQSTRLDIGFKSFDKAVIEPPKRAVVLQLQHAIDTFWPINLATLGNYNALTVIEMKE